MDLVSAHNSGQHRGYRLNGEALKTVHNWVKQIGRFWQHQLDWIKKRAEEKKKPKGPTAS